MPPVYKILPELDGYDWREAFGYAGDPEATNVSGYKPEPAAPGMTIDTAPFGRLDVVKLYGISEGENDGPPWLCYGKLRDGRFFFLTAGCDYTGWDCQASGNAVVADTKRNIEKLGLDDEARRRLGVKTNP